MERLEILSLPKVASHPRCRNLAMDYKSYCSIRRDLRTANAICEYVISLRQQLLEDPNALAKTTESLFLIRGALMHALVLYGRWFKATSRKPTLNPDTFFTDSSAEAEVHRRLIDLRDKYVAHYELDLLGSNRIWASFSSDGHFVGTDSDWIEQQFVQLENVNMQSFRQCIHTVHNKIDAVLIPEIQRKLNSQLRKLYA